MKLPVRLTEETDRRLERLARAGEEIALALMLIAVAVIISRTMGGQDG